MKIRPRMNIILFNSWTGDRFNAIAKGHRIKFRSGASIRNQFKMIIQPKDLKKIFQPQRLSHLDSFLDSEKSLLKLYAKDKKYIIPNTCKILGIFRISMSFFIVYSVISSLLDLAFDMYFEGEDILNSIVWVLFLIDLGLNFITERFDVRGRSIKNLKFIAKSYVKGWFIFDILAILPLRFWGHNKAEELLRLIRVFKIKTVFTILPMHSVIKYFLRNYKEQSIKYKKTSTILNIIWDFIVEIFSIIFFSFFTTCVFWYVSLQLTNLLGIRETFIIENQLEGENISESFIKTLYFIVTSMATVGYGDFLPENVYERIFISMILVYSTVWFTVSRGKALEFLEKVWKFNRKKSDFEKLDIFITQLENAHGLLPYQLKIDILSHFQYYQEKEFMKNCKLKIISDKKIKTIHVKNKISDTIPYKLKKQLFNFMYDDYFMHFRFFFPDNLNFKYKICKFFQPRQYTPGTIILNQGAMCDELIFIKDGSFYLGFYDYINQITQHCKRFQDWALVGDYSFFFNKPSFALYEVYSQTSGMAIPKAPLENLMKLNYSSLFNKVRSKIGLRSCRLLKIMAGKGFVRSEELMAEVISLLEIENAILNEEACLCNIYKSCASIDSSLSKIKQILHELKFGIY
ncbi:hypothetical protein SteCoe_15934 [Stentor coeruleus]|uniref:Cyclic nucleotide-binding domain-containing protein n=1 Tax=Stentor coeruleus TaxID=5963 RepID=A0A1R2C2J4_9CILI|nr:hypothetical protein SteCoe_15934 [Stentor coeruleus]